MRVTVATRIHLPEPSAASFRLDAVERALVRRGCKVTVLTTRYPTNRFLGDTRGDEAGVGVVSRWPVLRDKTGYVRGYLPYLSFDIPLFFRMVLSRRPNVALVEPPPTTGAVTRVASALRRFPYVWYAADVWSDATEIAGAPKAVVGALRLVEKFAIGGASGIIAVSKGVASRVAELGGQNIRVIPNGIDTDIYRPDVEPVPVGDLEAMGVKGPYALYAGTASEWQGASIFAEAFDRVAAEVPDAQLVFVGQGSEWGRIQEIGEALNEKYGREVLVQIPHSSAEFVAQLLASATVALVSIVPDQGYDFAYPTKVLAALSAGVPVLYAGKGPVADDLTEQGLGFAAPYDSGAIGEVLVGVFRASEDSFDPARLRNWVLENRSMKNAGDDAANFISRVAKGDKKVPTNTSLGKAETAGSPRTSLKKKSVAVVTPWYPNEENPVSGLFVKREVDALRAEGVDVRVIHLDRDVPGGSEEREIRDGLRVLHIGMNPSNPVSVSRAIDPLRAALLNVDVVNSHAISALPAVSLAHGGRPWVHTEHWSALSSPTATTKLLRTVRPAFASMLRFPDVVVAESERLADPIRKFRGDKPVSLIPCIVPAPAYLVPRPGKGDVLRLASTGGVIDRKNPLLAVETLSVLKERGVEASLRWTGDGDQREEATELAKELGVDAVFLGAGSPEDVEKEIAEADIFFAPTKGENFFVAAAEALVNGRPLCASDQGGHVEYADPRFTEIVVDQTPEAYAEALVNLRDRTRGVSAEQISDTVRDRFSPSTVAQMYMDLYDGLLEAAADRS